MLYRSNIAPDLKAGRPHPAGRAAAAPIVRESIGLDRAADRCARSFVVAFARRFSLGARAVGWREEDIQKWLDNLTEKS